MNYIGEIKILEKRMDIAKKKEKKDLKSKND